MITLERFLELKEESDNDYTSHFTESDDDVTAINLLRERIPYDVCKRIIAGADHDVIYLTDIDKSLPYLSEDDVKSLLRLGISYDSSLEMLYSFV